MYQYRDTKDIHLSKTLSWILRHGAIKEGFSITSDGYVQVREILSYKNLRGKYNLEDIKRVVATNDKQRFSLRTNDHGLLEIKANQGHSIGAVQDLQLKPITNSNDVINVIHGTYLKTWNSIKKNGLSRMNREHIHFTNIIDKDKVISGVRSNVNLLIYIDLEKALNAGIKFFISPNGVILSPGDRSGIISAEYFLKVINLIDGNSLI